MGRGRRYEAPHGELAVFRAGRAGLPEVSSGEAGRYVERHRARRPWLEAAERASPEAARVIAAADLGGGHGHIRHEGWVTEEASMRRVAYLEDPAQLDPDKRARGIDGLRPGDRHHICATLSSRIADPDAFATALVRGTGHPNVRAALSTPYDRGSRPDPVRIPITVLLGSDGHTVCTGWQLEPVTESIDAARDNRRATWHISGSVLSASFAASRTPMTASAKPYAAAPGSTPIRIASGPFTASTAPTITGAASTACPPG